MNNKEQPTMQSITALAKFLIETWSSSSCPKELCAMCKYSALCEKIEELAEVVNNEHL